MKFGKSEMFRFLYIDDAHNISTNNRRFHRRRTDAIFLFFPLVSSLHGFLLVRVHDLLLLIIRLG